MSYDVVLLVEQALTAQDARQVRGLHDSIKDAVRYHVLLPVDDAAVRVEGAMGQLGTGEAISPAPTVSLDQVDELQDELGREGADALATTLAALHAAGADAEGTAVRGEPVDALAAAVKRLDAAEAIVLTRPHVVAEFFHLDWSSRARRALGVPVLHLLEHENFDEQADGYGEGITGL